MRMLKTEYKEQNANHSMEFMESSIARKLDVLEKEFADINTEIETRTMMHSTILSELNRGIEAREMQIKEFGGWNYGTVFESRIMALEREINDMRKETRFEELNFWRDMSRLKEALRKVLKECWQIQSRKQFLDSYVSKLNNIEW
jgi:hypothetical protein